MFKSLIVEWKGGPKSIREQFNMLSSRPSFNMQLSEKDYAEYMKVANKMYPDFIPEDKFILSNCPTITEIDDTNEERLKKIFEFALTQRFRLSLPIIEDFKSTRTLSMFLVIQICLIEFVFNNNGVRFIMSEELTEQFMQMLSERFDVPHDKIRRAFYAIIKRCLDDGSGIRVLDSYKLSDNFLYIVLDPRQGLCIHSMFPR